MIDLPTAILCTISAGCIKDQPRGYRGLVEAMNLADGDIAFFYWRMSARPRFSDLLYIYFVMGNQIRWKARILKFNDAGIMEFNDGRQLYAKCWAVLYDFEKLPHPRVGIRGFQGFRYFDPESMTTMKA